MPSIHIGQLHSGPLAQYCIVLFDEHIATTVVLFLSDFHDFILQHRSKSQLESVMRWKECLVPSNLCSAVMVLLARSQQDHLAGASVAIGISLLAWVVTVFALLVIHEQTLLANPTWMILGIPPMWSIMITALQPSLTDAILLIPISIVISALCLSWYHNRRSQQEGDLHLESVLRQLENALRPLPQPLEGN